MKGKELREALKAGKAEAFERDPDLARGKKITGILLLIWAASRAFLLVMDLVCARIGFIESNPVNWVTTASPSADSAGTWSADICSRFTPV